MDSLVPPLPILGLCFFSAIALLNAAAAIHFFVSDRIREAPEDKLAPVKLSGSQSLLRALNPARWGGGQAQVRQAYPILRLGRPKSLLRIKLPGGAMGFRNPNPFAAQQVHYDVIWYQYQVKGATLWGKFQFPFGFDTVEQAQAVASSMVGKTLPIFYDPDCPEDSLPVFPSINEMRIR